MKSAVSKLRDALAPVEIESDTPQSESDERGVRDEVLPDDEVVHRELSNADGRMWQRTIAARTGWSESKTSRVLGEMEGDRMIFRHRVGREKLVYTPGAGPAASSREWSNR